VNYDVVAFWSQIAGFVLFTGALIWSWAQWISPALAQASKHSNERIALGEKHRDDMRLALDALRREIEVARRDGETMKERVRERSAHEFERTVAEAREAADRVIRNADEELERARVQARIRLRDDLAARAIEVAKAQAQQRIDKTVNATLVREFLQSLERGGRN
jgi:F-type H+-transporting ATPase subunit b